MAIVVDFAWTKPTVDQLKGWGAVAVGMYVSHDPGKNATPELVHEYASAGIKTFLFFEDSATNAAKGYSQGKADAELAKAKAEALGKPAWAPILPSADWDVGDYAPSSKDPKAKLGPLAGYWQAWNDVLGHRQTGGYGGYWPISRLAAAGLISVGVQTVAWSGGQVDLKHIACLQNARTLDNGNVDVELIESASLLARLAWVPGEAGPAPAPIPAPPAAPPTAPSGPRLWVTAGMDSLAQLAHDQHCEVSAILRLTAENSPQGLYPPDIATLINGVFSGTIDPKTPMPAGLRLWLPGA